MAQLRTVENDSTYVDRNYTPEFIKKDGIKYCENCGKECLSEDVICDCGKNNFISADYSKLNEIIGGYINLAKNGKLRDYYGKNNKKSAVRMNEKRIIQQLLFHKHKIIIDKKIIDKIYNANT